MPVLFEEKVELSFIYKAQEISDKLNIPLNWLMGVIELETAGTFSPSIKNSLGYVGLIQFGKAAAERIGTTQEELGQMTAVAQLDYVYLYYKIYKSKLKSYVDLYIATLFPAALGKNNDYVLQTSRLSAERVAKANPLFDLNKDLKITVGEIEEKLLVRIPNEFKEELKKKQFCQQCGQLLH